MNGNIKQLSLTKPDDHRYVHRYTNGSVNNLRITGITVINDVYLVLFLAKLHSLKAN